MDGLAFSLNLSLCPFCVQAVRKTPLLRGPDNRDATVTSLTGPESAPIAPVRGCVSAKTSVSLRISQSVSGRRDRQTDRVRKKEVCGFWLVADAVDAVKTWS